MVELIEKTFVFGSPAAVYAVPTQERGTVYMRVNGDEKTSVVVVDSVRFLALWRLSGEPLAQKSQLEWKEDYKIEDAEKGFTAGKNNPVPVIHVSFEIQKPHGQMQVGFSDGYTRTIWLLTHGAAAFPVKCKNDTAHALYTAAGVQYSRPVTTKDLLKDLSWEEWLSRQAS